MRALRFEHESARRAKRTGSREPARGCELRPRPCADSRRRGAASARGGFTLVEILVALAILSFCLPVFVLSQQNLAADKVHRLRLGAEQLCHNTLERFGRAEDNLLAYLKQSGEPSVFEGTDLWQFGEVAADIGEPAVRELIRTHDMHMEVRLQRDARAGLDLVVCRITWAPELGGKNRDSVVYARSILRDAGQ